MIRGTTPNITFTFKDVNVSDITVAFLTIEQNGINVIEKPLEEATVGEGCLEWPLTQAETLQLKSCTTARVQCRYGIGSVRYASRMYKVKVDDILKEGEI